MRGLPSWNRKRDIEGLLRARRPEAPATLLESIARQFERRQGRRISFNAPARVAVLSAALLVGLLAVGGVGFAASKIVTDFSFFGGGGLLQHSAPQTAKFNPAIQQYGSPTPTPTPTAPVNSSPPTLSGGTNDDGDTLTANPGTWSGDTPITFTYQFVSCNEDGVNCYNASAATTTDTYTLSTGDFGRRIYVVVVATNNAGTAQAQSALTGQITGTQPTTTPPPPPSSTTTTISSGGTDTVPVSSTQPTIFNFTAPDLADASVVVPAGTPADFVAVTPNPIQGAVSVEIVAKDANGQAVHQFSLPILIVLHEPCAFAPAVYENNGWRQIPLEPYKTVSPTTGDGYFKQADAGGTSCEFDIATTHLSIFGTVSRASLSFSETGRKFAAAGSDKWGDPEFIHTGKPHANVTTAATLVGDHNVKFGFFVDEQVAAYVTVYLHGKPLKIVAGQSVWRGSKLTGPTRTQVHKPVLRIGTVNANLKVNGLVRGAAVKITMIDYDGHKITRTLTVK